MTVIVPSHLAGLQLRRRLGQMGPFAGVRFETMPRLAEITAAGSLAAQGRSPLARPIGDYLAAQVALRARDDLAGVRELAGFGRVLRQLFRRLRRGGIASPESAAVPLSNGYMGELLRLFAEFRTAAASFYDEEDLLDAAARVARDRASLLAAELGDIYVVPPGALSAGADRFLQALKAVAPRFTTIEEGVPRAQESFVLAPDPASEAREAVREAVSRLESGLGIHEIAVFYGAGASYGKLLREAFAGAGIPAAIMPGVPLIETPAGRALLLLASLPNEDYSRTAMMDFLGIAPLKSRIPGRDGAVVPLPSTWDRLSREAGVTKGVQRWESGLGARVADLHTQAAAHDPDIEDRRRNAIQRQLETTLDMESVVTALVARLEPLRSPLPARGFIDRFLKVVDEYLRPDAPAMEEVRAEIEQLGTVGAVGGSFGLGSLVQALRANLEIAVLRERGLGEGVLVADYRVAAGLEFRHAALCGAYEGAFPAGPGGDTLVDDAEWARLRQRHPFIEDTELRIRRAKDAATRALASAGRGTLTWMAPLYEPGGTREYYPSALMLRAARRYDGGIRSASDLRRAGASDRLRRPPSPLAASLRGPPVDRGEAALREAVAETKAGVTPGPGHRLHAPLLLLRSRRSHHFTEYDGSLVNLASSGPLMPSGRTSPTSLETYSVCGFRYFCSYVLRLNVVEEPEEREIMEAAARGSLIHEVLDAFFKERKAEGRPVPYESWTATDLSRLLQHAEQRLEEARRRGQMGLEIFADHDARTILADLRAFIEADNVFRGETGAVPSEFEVQIPPISIAGIEMRGFVDRVDRTPDGRKAWVIDYKTGSAQEYRTLETQEEGPFAGGAKLQLPAYVSAAGDAKEVEALYWFISRKGDFKRIPYSPSAENQGRFEATVAAILRGIDSGAFPAVPGDENDYFGGWTNCRYCDFHRICSRRRDLDFVAKSADKAIEPWRRVGETARGPGQ